MTFFPIVVLIFIFIMIDGMPSISLYLFKSTAYLGAMSLYELKLKKDKRSFKSIKIDSCLHIIIMFVIACCICNGMPSQHINGYKWR